MTAALWLAVGTAAGVLVGVALADRGGKGTLKRLTGALKMFEKFSSGLGTRDSGLAAQAGDGDDELDDDEFETADGFGDSGIDFEETVAFDDTVEEDDATEDEGTGFEPDTAVEHIDERVLAAFEQDPILSERDIEIDEPEPAVIALTGRVATAKDAQHAVTIARGVPGVERVESYIKVRHRAPVSPPPQEADV